MFSLTGSIHYWVCRRTVDMRNGINGLMAIVEGEFGLRSTSGDAYVFFSKDGSTVKMLRWDTDGFLLYHKKLAKGTFERTAADGSDAPRYELSWERFCLIMQGVSLKKVKFRSRFKLPARQ